MMRRAQPWLGTLVDITLEPQADARAVAAAFSAIAHVHRRMSFHDTDSDVTRFNRAEPGELIEVDRHTWAVLQLADRVRLASDGCFNIACAPRLVEWGCLPAPSGAAPAYVPAARNYELEEDGCVRKTAAAWIDLGGIAKGYAVDLAIGALQQHGVASACVNAGGDLRVIGGADWPIAIRAPQAPTSIGAHLMLRDAALATSANYFSGGGDAGALVDGRDGQARTALYSVTVRAPSCALADALTKVVMASGDENHACVAAFGAAAFII
jgi:thiamine biosynthesis lipoprotein